MSKRFFALTLLVAVLVAALQWSRPRPGALVVSGFVEADEIRVGSLVGGRVHAVHVHEGDAVAAGALLVELEPFDLLQQKAQAVAERELRAAQLAELRAGFRKEEVLQAEAKQGQVDARLRELLNGARPQEIAAAEAYLRQAKADYELAQNEFRRISALEHQEIATKERLDETRTRLDLTQAQVQARENVLALLVEGPRVEAIDAARAELAEMEQRVLLLKSGARPEEIAAAEAAVAAAEAAVRSLDQRIEELRVVASTPGVVDAIDLQPGDLVAARAPILSLVDRTHLWVRAYVPENRLDFTDGTRVEVRVDSYPGRRFAGVVRFLARTAEFTPGNVQTPEERSKQVFRIKVDLVDGLDVLRPGMAADVEFPAPTRGDSGR